MDPDDPEKEEEEEPVRAGHSIRQEDLPLLTQPKVVCAGSSTRATVVAVLRPLSTPPHYHHLLLGGHSQVKEEQEQQDRGVAWVQ
jgi:hypothetical protein